MPSEAEWEKEARGTDGRIYPWGFSWDTAEQPSRLNFPAAGTGGTTAVGIYLEGGSPYGANDMLGNVFQWVADWYDENYYPKMPTSDPLGPTQGTQRVVRGGGWFSNQSLLHTAWRRSKGVEETSDTTGFRCARDVQP